MQTEAPPKSRRTLMREKAHARRVVEAVSYLRGFTTGLDTINVEMAVEAMQPGEAIEWAKELDRAISRIRALRRELGEHS